MVKEGGPKTYPSTTKQYPTPRSLRKAWIGIPQSNLVEGFRVMGPRRSSMKITSTLPPQPEARNGGDTGASGYRPPVLETWAGSATPRRQGVVGEDANIPPNPMSSTILLDPPGIRATHPRPTLGQSRPGRPNSPTHVGTALRNARPNRQARPSSTRTQIPVSGMSWPSTRTRRAMQLTRSAPEPPPGPRSQSTAARARCDTR